MLNRLTSFLNKHDIIAKNQHGFRKDKSTSTASLEFYDNIMRTTDQHKMAILHFAMYLQNGVLCDLQKAFDCVQYRKLLTKLDVHGIRGNVANWFATYFGNRILMVKIKFKPKMELQQRPHPAGYLLIEIYHGDQF